jgi:pyridoxine 4-dehydrogenase
LQGIHYGTPEANSLHLLRYYFEKYPEDADKVVLSIKGAFSPQKGPDGSPEALRASVESAVTVLGRIKTIDVFEMARVDPNVSIETSVQALAELVEEGQIRGIGLSEVSASTVRRAHAMHPIAAVEIELSLFTPDTLRNGLVATCHERTQSLRKMSQGTSLTLCSCNSCHSIQPYQPRLALRDNSHAR